MVLTLREYKARMAGVYDGARSTGLAYGRGSISYDKKLRAMGHIFCRYNGSESVHPVVERAFRLLIEPLEVEIRKRLDSGQAHGAIIAEF